MGTIIAAVIILAILIPAVTAWANALEKFKDGPEWKEHKDDPDYWDWP